ncbi:MAG: amidohydrolase family protein, partial [Gammaproteobacteria bacterium]
SHNAYLSRQGAGIAVAYGLPWEEALKAITFNVADTFKLSDKGQVTEGMHADLVVWDGDPLEVTSFAELVFIQGEIHQITSRSARLMERYRDLN